VVRSKTFSPFRANSRQLINALVNGWKFEFFFSSPWLESLNGYGIKFADTIAQSSKTDKAKLRVIGGRLPQDRREARRLLKRVDGESHGSRIIRDSQVAKVAPMQPDYPSFYQAVRFLFLEALSI
jgi:hypothetical protein